MTDIYFEGLFRGSPASFVHFATEFTSHIDNADIPAEFWPIGVIDENALQIEMLFFGSGGRKTGMPGSIVAEQISGERSSVLKVKIPEQWRNVLASAWDLIYQDMKEHNLYRSMAIYEGVLDDQK